MAVARAKTWIDQEVLTHTDLNAEFNNILNNGEDLGWPATKAKDLDGQELILDADADTSITADTDDQIDFRMLAADCVVFSGVAGQANVFNENSIDVDFRVESNGSTHMFFVNAGDNQIIIDPSATITTADGTLHIHTASAGAATVSANADDLVVESNFSGGITILTPDTSASNVFFGSPASTAGAVISWQDSLTRMTVGTNFAAGFLELKSAVNVTAITIDADQNVFGTVGTTGMTDGFIFIPAAAGAPSGAVAVTTATLAALYFDTTNDTLNVYDHVANAWLSVGVS